MYKERIQELLKAQDGDPDMLEFVESRVNTMIDYVQYVSFMEVRMQRIQIEGLIGEEWRDAMESLDHNRHSKHEVAIAAVNQLNRLSAAGGLEPFYDEPADNEHRYDIGNLCQAVVDEYFAGRDPQKLELSRMQGENDFKDAVEKLSQESGEVQAM